jgi:RNA polymerase sigma-70 factor (ECF subfamily)
MERIQNGDTAALDEVLRRFWLPLVSYAAHLLRDPDAAEDAVQEALLRFWEARATWMASDRLGGFLYQATRNICLNELDKRRVRTAWTQQQRRSERPQAASPLELTERAQLRALLIKVIDELPPKRREVFVLARFHARTYRDIAEIMDISPRTVANQLSAAVRDLRKRLQPELAKFLPDEAAE